MKRFALISLIALIMIGLCAGVFSVSATDSGDPADIYKPQIAPYEDPSIDLWFEHSFKKIMTSDITPSDMDTYSVYMAKNEIENAQFVLYSDETKTKMRASVTDFKDEYGNTVDAELYYQMYITLENLNTLAYPGATEENTVIRNGEQPDPIVPASKIGRFQLNGGKSQAFYIRLKTTEDSAPGWYSAQLNIYNSDSQIVKTATVYAYVWDFTIEEKTELKTSFFLDSKSDNYGSYKEYYDYLLENRILAMDIPGNLDSSNPYVTNDRVSAIRVSAVNGGNVGAYLDHYTAYPEYADIYADLSSMAEWEEIKDKFYFYTLDEAMSKEFIDTMGWGTGTIDDVIYRSEYLDKFWPNAAKVIPYHENHAYPYYTYDGPIASQDISVIKDGVQGMIDSASCTVWCPQYYGFTPLSEILSHDYDQNRSDAPIRTLAGNRSGNILAGESYFNWEGVFGDLRDRIVSSTIVRNRDENNNDEVWTYSAGYNSGYAYPNHLIDNTGLQTKMLFWQMYQLDIDGYLYYGANFWTEYDDRNGNHVDTTVTGNKKAAWKVNMNPTYADGHPVYGNGMLFYTASMASLSNVDYIGSVRVEIMRDGIEEYQMFTMLENLQGDRASDSIVNSVSKNVINYISMPEFDRSALDPALDDYDVMALARIELGNEIESAMNTACDHKYDDGKVTKEPQCLVMGEITYTCVLCGAENIENLPTLHADGECFEVTIVTEPTCETEGKNKLECGVCGYVKYDTVKAFHDSGETIVYTVHPTFNYRHKVECTACDEAFDEQEHTFRAEYTNTCVDAGVQNDVCIYCGHVEKVADVEAHGHNMKETTVAPTCEEAGYTGGVCYNCGHQEGEELAALGHNYVDGICENCGNEEAGASQVEKGDIDGNGNINSVDLFKMNLFVKQIVVPEGDEALAADIDGNGKVNSVDMFYLKFRILKGYWG